MPAMQLDTERLILRDFKATDWKSVHEYAVDPEVVKFMIWGPNTVEETQHFLDLAIEKQRQKPRHTFELAVTLKDDGRLIGATGLRVQPHDLETAEVGYCYNRKYWRQGFSSEACARMLRFGFTELGLHRIYATCDLENVGSAGVLRKCGMRQEGHFVKDKFIKGKWRDTLLFAILREEWEAKNNG